ncbi:MAG: putative lipid II flippase FtsW [Candidatus Sumerlaeaceae bacterium]|nr:putative lipid II flippase FtsW [Candidatus Sumerlaeaceae bacterium]
MPTLPIQNHAKWLFILALILTGIGVVFVLSASAPYAAKEEMRHFANALNLQDANIPTEAPSVHGTKFFLRQLFWALVSFFLLWIVSFTDYSVHARMSKVYLLVTIVLLICVFVPYIGLERNGAHRWVRLGPFQIQPSELAKVALILHCARQFQIRSFVVRRFRAIPDLVPHVVLLSVLIGLIVIEPDLGTCVVLGTIAVAMWAIGGVPLRYLASMFLIGLIGVVAAIVFEPYRVKRVLAFMDPEKDPLGAGYQLLNSLIAVGTGGLTGRGLGQGPAKYLFLSECHTDFIFSIICEETGFIGATIVILLFLCFVIIGLDVAKRVNDPTAKLIAAGISLMIGVQAFGSMAVALGLVPTKGLALPLISYGGSSLLANMLAIGILINIAKNVAVKSKPHVGLKADWQ